jgi:hypothetical protein
VVSPACRLDEIAPHARSMTRTPILARCLL